MNSQESSRNWAEAVKASADVAVRDRAPCDEEIIVVGTQATGWDPGEVWLSRIKQPRDRAAIRAIR
jgi:D-hexose-6-phosphate mutarotase